MSKLVSILIPVYNRQDYIGDCLESALFQTYNNIEIIVIDNCSDDGTWGVVQSYVLENPGKIKAFKNEVNLGPVRNWLRALYESNGDYIKVLWSDDKMDKTFIEKALPYLEKKCSFVYSRAQIFGDKAEHESLFSFSEMDGIYDTSEFLRRIYLFDPFSGRMPYSPGCAIFTRSTVLKVWNEDFLTLNFSETSFTKAIGPDVLLFLQGCIDGEKFGYINEVLSHFRAHDQSISTHSASHLKKEYQSVKDEFLRLNSGMLTLSTRIKWLFRKLFR